MPKLNYTKIIPNNYSYSSDLKAVCDELEYEGNYNDYAFDPDDNGREILRKRLRVTLGFDPNDTQANPLDAKKNTHSPLNSLLNDAPLYITSEGWVIKDSEYKPKLNQNVLKISPDEVKKRQDEVQIWYDHNKITKEQVLHIQQLKAGLDIKVPSGKSLSDYKQELEQLSSYVVVRGEVQQLYLMDEKATVLIPPRNRVLYYATFPKLQISDPLSKDLIEFTDKASHQKRQLNKKKIAALKRKFKDVLRLQIRVAAFNSERLDVVTPNAFFYALTDADQKKAKALFYEAVAEIACEPIRFGFQGLFLHTDPNIDMTPLTKLTPAQITIPIIIGNGDASAPQLASQKINSRSKVAESIMGEGIGPVGNYALGQGANKAKEENDTRMMGGYNELVFSPIFNNNLYDIDKHFNAAYDESINPPEIMTLIDELEDYAYFLKNDDRIHALRVPEKGERLSKFVTTLRNLPLEELDKKLIEFYDGKGKPNSDYEILNKGQGFFTRLFPIKTTTLDKIDALNTAVQQKKPKTQATTKQ